MIHQRAPMFQTTAPEMNTDALRPNVTKAQKSSLPATWWIVPAVIGGASVWAYAISYAVSAAFGAA